MAKKKHTVKVDRLIVLRDTLRKDAKNPKGLMFDLGDWISVDMDEFSEKVQDDVYEDRVSITKVAGFRCGTTACAFGAAALIPKFQKLGLKVDLNGTPKYKNLLGTKAAAKFFGISEFVADRLFLPENYPEGYKESADGEFEVAARLQRIIDQPEKADHIAADLFTPGA